MLTVHKCRVKANLVGRVSMEEMLAKCDRLFSKHVLSQNRRFLHFLPKILNAFTSVVKNFEKINKNVFEWDAFMTSWLSMYSEYSGCYDSIVW